MKNSRLHELLSKLSASELTALGKYLNSPFFNQRTDVRVLFEYYKTHKDSHSGRALDDQAVWEALFPEEAYNEKQYRYLRSFLHRAIQDFLVHRDVANLSELAYFTRLTRLLRQRGLEQQAGTALKKAGKALHLSPLRNIDFCEEAYQYHAQRYESEARQRRAAASSFQDMAEASDMHFVANKLRQGCTAHVYRAITEADYKLEMLAESLALVERKGWQQIPAIGLYYYAYRALTESDARHWFEQFRTAMNHHFQQFTRAEMRDLYTLAVNYCIRQINTRQEKTQQALFLQQVFEIYQEGLDKGVFMEEGVLSRFTYNNIANAGMGLKAFEWVESFLNSYRKALEPAHQESAYAFNLASLHFRRSNYGEVLKLLTQTEFQDLLHQLDARRMLLRSYYELDELTALDSLLDSFHIFLRRRRDIGYLRQNYLNLIRLTRKLLQTPAHDKGSLASLKQEVLSCKSLAERDWLLEKLEPSASG
jgi:hypothetical protein